jgi:hypothetical protein
MCIIAPPVVLATSTVTQPRAVAPDPDLMAVTPMANAHTARVVAIASMTRRSRGESVAREACCRCQ